MKAATDTHPAVYLEFGNFLQVTFDFLIVAFAVFVIIKLLMQLKRRKKQPLQLLLHLQKKRSPSYRDTRPAEKNKMSLNHI